MVKMKIGLLLTIALLCVLIGSPAFAYTHGRATTHFAMGFYHLYDDDLEASLDQFEYSLLYEKNPPALLFSLLAEVSNILGNIDSALTYAKMALRIEPLDESALQTISLVYMSANRYEDAIPYLEELLLRQPDDIQVLLYLADAYNSLEDEEGLILIYNQILQYHPNFIDVSLNLGYLYTKRGNFGLAENEFKRVLELDPGNEKALFYLTYIYISDGKTKEALKVFKSLDDQNLLSEETLQDYAINLFIEEQDTTPILRRINNWEDVVPVLHGIRHYSEGDLEKAKTVFTESLLEEPDNVSALVGLVRIAEKQNMWDAEQRWRFRLAGSYYRYGRYEKAENESRRVKQMDPRYLENRYLLGDILGAIGNIEEAIEEYEYFVQHADEPGDVHIKLGLAYDQIGKHDVAIQYFNEASELFPENDELLYYLGIEYRIVQDYSSAIDVFKRAIQLNDSDARYYFHLGVSYERMGRLNEAIEYLDLSVKLDDSSAAALNYLGYLLADDGVRLEEARTYIEMALAIDPENGAYLDSMGWVLYRLEEYQEAIEYLESAVQLIDVTEEENYVIYEHLGDVYYKMGMYLEAVRAWEEALELKQLNDIQKKIDEVRTEFLD
jgi:tetratricopeptide (TPR) repeat protein